MPGSEGYDEPLKASGVQPLPKPEYMRVNPTRRKYSRKYGPVEFERFDHLVVSQVNVGQGTIDKVKVDCKLLFSKTKWGTLGAASRYSKAVPAGIMYMDLTFDQPKDCRLSSATVTVMLEDKAAELDEFHTRNAYRTVPVRHGPMVHVTEYFGPKAIVGAERTVTQKTHVQVKPAVEFVGTTVSGIEYDKESTMDRSSRWSFSGKLVLSDAGYQVGTDFLYKGLRWDLTENDSEHLASHISTMNTAFAFIHGAEPLVMRIQIDGKLKGRGARAKNRLLEFPRKFRGNNNSVSTLINLRDRRAFVSPLDELAQSLEVEMLTENLARIPVEVPEKATFRTELLTSRPSIEDGSSNVSKNQKQVSDSTDASAQKDATPPSDEADVSVSDEGSTTNVPGPSIEDLIRAMSEVATLAQQQGFRKDHIDAPSANVTDLSNTKTQDHNKPDGISSADEAIDKKPSDAPFLKFQRIKSMDFWKWVIWLITVAIIVVRK